MVANMDVIGTSWLDRRSYEHMQKWYNRQRLAKQFELKQQKVQTPTPLTLDSSIDNIDVLQTQKMTSLLMKASMHINSRAERYKKNQSN